MFFVYFSYFHVAVLSLRSNCSTSRLWCQQYFIFIHSFVKLRCYTRTMRIKTHIGGIPIREYNRIHKWAERKLIKIGICFYCSKHGKTCWSNIDHNYNQDPTEWQEVCHKCHMAYDMEVLGIFIPTYPWLYTG